MDEGFDAHQEFGDLQILWIGVGLGIGDFKKGRRSTNWDDLSDEEVFPNLPGKYQETLVFLDSVSAHRGFLRLPELCVRAVGFRERTHGLFWVQLGDIDLVADGLALRADGDPIDA